MARLPIPTPQISPQRQLVARGGGRQPRGTRGGPLPESGVLLDPNIINPVANAARRQSAAISQASQFISEFAIAMAQADNDNSVRESRNITAKHYADYQESLRTNNNPDSYNEGLPILETTIDTAISEKFPNLSKKSQAEISAMRGDAKTRNDIAVNKSANTRRINNMKTDVLRRVDDALRIQDRDLALNDIAFGLEVGVLAPEDALRLEQDVNRKLDYYNVTDRVQVRDPRILEELQEKNDKGVFQKFTHLDPQSRKVLINSAMKIDGLNAREAASGIINMVDDGRSDLATIEIERLKETGVLKGWDLIGMRNLVKAKENETATLAKRRQKLIDDNKKFIKDTETKFLKGFKKGQFTFQDVQNANIPQERKDILTKELAKYEAYTRTGADFVETLDAIDSISSAGAPARELSLELLSGLEGKISDTNFRRLIVKIYEQQDKFEKGTENNWAGFGGREGASDKEDFGLSFLRSIYDPIFKQPDPWLAINSYEGQREQLAQFIQEKPEVTEEEIREFARGIAKETVNNFSIELITDTGLSTVLGNPIVDANFKKLLDTVSDVDRADIDRALGRGLSKRQILDFANQRE